MRYGVNCYVMLSTFWRSYKLSIATCERNILLIFAKFHQDESKIQSFGIESHVWNDWVTNN